jgi:enoyl-CoA hydratase
MNAEPEILFERRGHAGLVTLNRPRALNALNLSMVRLLDERLEQWAKDERIAHVVVQAAGEKAFCAGGDIRQLYEWGKAGDRQFLDFYREEYRLNTRIKRYPKPYIALIDGIVMGGGVGISVHGSHRVVGERTMFAMPETGIGLFPDVGGTYFLPRLPGRIGTWLALTGARLGQADALWCGVATHAAPSNQLGHILTELTRTKDAEAVMTSLRNDPSAPPILPARKGIIDQCFDASQVVEVMEKLEAETGPHGEWAHEQARIMSTKSPLSLAIAMRQMREGARAQFEECMSIEWRIVNRIFTGHDFFEGVRALIIDKDNAPGWRPAGLDKVDASLLDAHFQPLASELYQSSP